MKTNGSTAIKVLLCKSSRSVLLVLSFSVASDVLALAKKEPTPIISENGDDRCENSKVCVNFGADIFMFFAFCLSLVNAYFA